MNSRKETHYDTLQVSRKATLLEIKANYKKLALEYHTDKNMHLDKDTLLQKEEAFKKLTNAYQILSDATKRNQYDRQLAKELSLEQETIHNNNNDSSTSTQPEYSYLPTEILQEILSNIDSRKAFLNFRATSTYFRDVLNNLLCSDDAFLKLPSTKYKIVLSALLNKYLGAQSLIKLANISPETALTISRNLQIPYTTLRLTNMDGAVSYHEREEDIVRYFSKKTSKRMDFSKILMTAIYYFYEDLSDIYALEARKVLAPIKGTRYHKVWYLDIFDDQNVSNILPSHLRQNLKISNAACLLMKEIAKKPKETRDLDDAWEYMDIAINNRSEDNDRLLNLCGLILNNQSRKQFFGGRNFQCTNLTRAALNLFDCTATNFKWSCFRNSKLTTIGFLKANLSHCDLSYSSWVNAFINQTDFSFANLTGVVIGTKRDDEEYQVEKNQYDWASCDLTGTKFLSKRVFESGSALNDELISIRKNFKFDILSPESCAALIKAVTLDIIENLLHSSKDKNDSVKILEEVKNGEHGFYPKPSFNKQLKQKLTLHKAKEIDKPKTPRELINTAIDELNTQIKLEADSQKAEVKAITFGKMKKK